MKRTCKECNKEFEITEGEIKFYESKNFDLPKRCEECRDKNNSKSNSKNSSNKSSNQNGKNNKKKNTAISIVACLVILISGYIGVEEVGNNNNQSSTSTSISQEYSHEHEFGSEDSYVSHFEKHGDEFPYATKEEYLEGANRVINSPDALQKEEAEDGDKIYYLEDSNEIVFMSKEGEIRTYFKPSDGMDYYNRQ